MRALSCCIFHILHTHKINTQQLADDHKFSITFLSALMRTYFILRMTQAFEEFALQFIEINKLLHTQTHTHMAAWRCNIVDVLLSLSVWYNEHSCLFFHHFVSSHTAHTRRVQSHFLSTFAVWKRFHIIKHHTKLKHKLVTLFLSLSIFGGFLLSFFLFCFFRSHFEEKNQNE